MSDRIPFAYLITFTCYGTRLHGDARGSVDRHHNVCETNPLPPDANRYKKEKSTMKNQNYLLDEARRIIVLDELKKICDYCKWFLIAAHIRSNHIHLIVKSDEIPENLMTKIKLYLSRRINQEFPSDQHLKKWTRHGSTRYIWAPLLAQAAIEYVLYRQGKPMQLYKNVEFAECEIEELDELWRI